MKTVLFIGILMAGLAVTMSNTGCKKKTDDPVDQPKTLTKALLYDKTWYTKGNTISHKFNSDGKYYDIVGTWKWRNNSDTMEITFTSNGSKEVWHFQWNNEHEFYAHANGKGSGDLFKDQKW